MTFQTTSTSYPGQKRTIMLVTVVISALFFAVTDFAEARSINGYDVRKSINHAVNDVVSSSPQPRPRLLSAAPKTSVDKPDRFWGDISNCSKSDIVITQGIDDPLPSGIPTYKVHILNACATGCDISNIHIHCGSFSSASLIDAHVFKRIAHDDCLVNGGKPLRIGDSISFQYADTFSHSLHVSSMRCSKVSS